MDRGAWWAMVHIVTKNQTQLKRLSMHTQFGGFNSMLKIKDGLPRNSLLPFVCIKVILAIVTN